MLRLDAFYQPYGGHQYSGWIGALERPVRSAARVFVPQSWIWPARENEHDLGDPINYVRFAREMRSFYQPHVREPLFLATTRLFLWVTDGRDVAVSLASTFYSILMVVAAYLLGASLGSRAVGLAAGAALAIEPDVSKLALGGWRDEAAAFFCVMSAWAFVRMYSRPSWQWSVVAGVMSAAACLTRITSAIFIVPALIYLCLPDGRTPLRIRGRQVALAAGVAIGLVAPYLVSCALEFGDPLYAINYHVRFYSAREQSLPPLDDQAVAQLPSASRYVLAKFRDRPIAAVDTAVQGLTSYPFLNKWHGFVVWHPAAGRVLAFFAIGGLLIWVVLPRERLLLVVLVSSLVPFMMTWPIRGGAEWRFTLHAYPFFLVASFWMMRVIVSLAHKAATSERGSLIRLIHDGKLRRRAAIVLMAVVTGAAATYIPPYLVAREELFDDQATFIVPGPRDRLIFSNAWSDLTTVGNVVARFATGRSAALRLPLPVRREYEIELRMDPLAYAGASQQRVQILLEGRSLGTASLTYDPLRVGTYRFTVPAEIVRPGATEVELVADNIYKMAWAGDQFPELSRDQDVAFRLWYVGIWPK